MSLRELFWSVLKFQAHCQDGRAMSDCVLQARASLEKEKAAAAEASTCHSTLTKVSTAPAERMSPLAKPEVLGPLLDPMTKQNSRSCILQYQI